jgi:catechol 2,3-dioxygenase-like lactoylglutathione lyase family enzyme
MSTNASILTKGIDNLDILCNDVDRMASYYHDVLGLPFFYTHEPGQGWACLDAGNLRIYLVETPVERAEPQRSADQSSNPPGYDLIAFTVDDLDAAQAELDRRQIEWVGEVITWEHPSGTWYRYRAIRDPEGNLVYITEPHVSEASTRLTDTAQAPTSSRGTYPY